MTDLLTDLISAGRLPSIPGLRLWTGAC
jgi:hypothetical protein